MLLFPNAVTGLNGDNETNIVDSKQLRLNIYDDNKSEIQINNLANLIDMWIPQYPKADSIAFDLVDVKKMSRNGSNETSNFDANGFYSNYFNFTGVNAAVSIQIKPNNTNMGYLVIFKFGEFASFDTFNNAFDKFRCFCPGGNQFNFCLI